jgi:hypothetical protein
VGGEFVTQNKVRPGVYINFISEAAALGTLGERGIATIALSLSWGEPKKVLEINAGDNTKDLLGYDIADSKMLLIKEALKRAKTLLLYRLNIGTKATVNIGATDILTVTAKYGGVRGNDITIVIETNVDDNTKYDVTTVFAGEEVDVQTVANIDGLVDNAWVDFSGTGTLTTTAGTPLASGADGTVTNQDHSDYLAAVELFDFQSVALTSTDATLKSVYVSFAQRLRDTEGKKIQAVLENYSTADYEGVISVKNGVILSDGTTLSASQAVAWVAGATAGATMNQSLTYTNYDDAVDASPRYTNAQIEAALLAGEFIFVPSNGRAAVEQDINSFTSFTPEKSKKFSKNRVIRVLDGIANDLTRIFKSFYIGKVDNNTDGRGLFKNEIVNYLNILQNIGAIQNFDPQADITVTAGVEADSIYVEVSIQPVDSVEKVYMKVRVK